MTTLKEAHPELIKEWDYKLNTVDISIVAAGSHKKAWWICSNNHSYDMSIEKRSKGRGCPICSGKKILKGFNDITTTNPDIAKEWDYDKNEITPDTISKGSNKKVWWICEKGHSYEASINKRCNAGRGCPICSNQKIITGINDLATVYPELIKEWDYDKNTLSPTMIAPSTAKKVWWICKKGHSYQTTVNHKTRGDQCPICSNKTIVAGINDLATICPDIVKEWSPKNKISPTEVSIGSKKDIIWCCSKCKQEWTSKIYVRTKYGCPRCKESKGEKIISEFLSKNNITYIPQYRFDNCRNVKTLPFDFAIVDGEKVLLLIEYDGIQHFQPVNFSGDLSEAKLNFKRTVENDNIKNEYCKNNNIKLLRIKYTQIDSIEKLLKENVLYLSEAKN